MALAAVFLLAVWLDPSEPAAHAQLTYSLLAGYLGYSLLIIAVLEFSDREIDRLGLISHLIDIPAFTAFIYLTQGPTSPFFVYFVFSLLAAALRWQWRGVLWTAMAILAIYVGLGLYAQIVLRDPAFQLNRFIIRSFYLAIVAIMLGYLSAYEQRLRAELVRLAAWPRHVPTGSLIQESLRHAASILGAQRVSLIWEESEEPWLYRATLANGEFDCVREPSTEAAPLVAEPLAEADYLCMDATRRPPAVVYTTAAGLQLARLPPLAADLEARFGAKSILSLYLVGADLQGRLFVLDKPDLTVDDLSVGRIVARQMAAELDQFYVQQRLQQAAVSEERVHFARELHDGVLQSLTGLNLQLEALQPLIEASPQAAQGRLREIQDLVTTEQRDLRFFVRQMRPLPLTRTEVNASLIPYLEELCQRAERQWHLRVELSVDTLSKQLSETLAHGVYRIVQEAFANSARHGRAGTVRVHLRIRDHVLLLQIADDGHGFPFVGRYDLAALNALGQGPRSIKERVVALAGELVVDSQPSGARLEIELPLRPALRVVATNSAGEPAAAARGSRASR
jgi:signal transduction histidine kinase